MDLHHIYPKDWFKNNASGPLKTLLKAEAEGESQDWVNSAANLIPMHRQTNSEWSKNAPATFLAERKIDYDSRQDLWNWYFVDREAYQQLKEGEQGVVAFWSRRANLIADEIFDRTAV